MGVGTQGCVERVVFHADDLGVCPVCPPIVVGELSAGGAGVCFGADVQADAGDGAVCVAAAGLLAAKSNSEFGIRNSEFHKFGPRKNSIAGAGGGVLRRHDVDPNRCHQFDPAAVATAGECFGVVFHLPRTDVLAGQAGRSLPSARTWFVAGRNHHGGAGAGGHFCGRMGCPAETSLFAGGVAVVSGNVGADWAGAGGRAGARGPLHLSAANRLVFDAGLAGC